MSLFTAPWERLSGPIEDLTTRLPGLGQDLRPVLRRGAGAGAHPSVRRTLAARPHIELPAIRGSSLVAAEYKWRAPTQVRVGPGLVVCS